tara:strand:+ start:12081 stop:14408 length:2328 start_codon:yes stop_codon:yes gene_type:complete
MAWEEYLGKTVGFAKVMGKMPYSDGSLALEIMNLTLNPEGFLESKFRIMPLIPNEWSDSSASAYSSGPLFSEPNGTFVTENPQSGLSGVLAMKYFLWDGVAPELIWLSSQGVFRFIPGSRYGEMPDTSGYVAGGQRGFRELRYFTDKNVKRSVTPTGIRHFPPQIEVVGNRVYFTYCDGGQAYVWDGDRLRDYGFYSHPSPPHAVGPAAGEDWVNDGGFSDGGRIGTLNHNLVDVGSDGAAITTGGIEAGLWYYSVVFENADGSYSATSEPGGRVAINHHVAKADSPWTKYGIDFLCRRFWVNSVPKGPPGTIARILLRTMNLRALPSSDDGSPRFLHRIANNSATDYMDDIPDGELGPVWQDRRTTPRGFFFMKSFSGSMFVMRTEMHSSRVWWSEQGNVNGATPESFFASHWRDVFPETGPLTGALPAILGERNLMLLFKDSATHYVSGDYPEWSFGTISKTAGCAGPNLSQASPDGTIIWYGNGTFWQLGSEGGVIDIGAAVRQKLKHVNKTRERFGVSWIDPVTKEMVFVLPYKNSDEPNMQFIWDYQNNGWRLRKDLSIRAAERVGDLICTAGKWSGRVNESGKAVDNIYIYGRGYPNFPAGGSLNSTYQTGWCSFSDFGPSLHDTHRAAEAIFMFEERSGSHSTLKMFADWDLDSQIGSGITVSLSHPETNSIPLYDGDINGGPDAVDSEMTMDNTAIPKLRSSEGRLPFRTRRVYTHRVPIDIPSCNVFSLSMTSSAIHEPFALISLDVFGPKTSLPGSRSPAIYEGN